VSRIGIDLGGTKTEGIILNDNLEPIERKRIPTPQNDYNAILNSVVDLINDLKAKTNDSIIWKIKEGRFNNLVLVLKRLEN